MDRLNSVQQKKKESLLVIIPFRSELNKEKLSGQACLSDSFLDLKAPHWRCFTLWENLGKDASCTTSCLDAGGTLATRLNSNDACMGLPPDDMIGILTQTNIQNRIREQPNKWQPIQCCSCVLLFSMLSLREKKGLKKGREKKSGLLHFGIQSPYKVCDWLFRVDFPNFSSLVPVERTRTMACNVVWIDMFRCTL